jgi:hypothetical protein
MMLFSKDRRDGIYLKDLASFKKFLPWIMPGINQSAVYFRSQVDLKKTVPFVQAWNEKGGQLTLFQVLAAALLRVGLEIPAMNRFVSGRRIYERRERSVAFTMKAGDGDATTKVRLRPGDTLSMVSAQVLAAIHKEREAAAGQGRNIFDTLQHFPRWLLRLIMGLWRVLDYHDLLPRFIYDMVPMYSSVYIANLGSSGIDAPLHHLFDFGNVSLFITLGNIHQAHITTPELNLELRPIVNLGITMDERIVSGHTAARAVTRLKELMEDPSPLEFPWENAARREP